MTAHDGTGPYIRIEATLALAIITSDDLVLHDDMVEMTMAFGRPIADGPAIDSGKVTSERTVEVLGQQLANLAQAVKVFIGQNFAFLETIEGGRGMLDDVRDQGRTVHATGYAVIRTVDPGEKAARA